MVLHGVGEQSLSITLYNVCAVPWGVLSTVGGVQYRGGISWVPWGISWVPWGVFSTVGDIMINVGGYLEYRGGVQHRGGYHEYRGGLSWVPWGMFSTVGGYHDARGGYHEYRGGCSVPWGEKSFVIWVPHGTEHPPRYSWYPPTCIMISPTVLKFQRMVSPTVLNTPHGTQDNPHGTHDIPHGTEHPPRYSRYPPTFIMISPHGTEHPPRYSRYPPRYSWYPPTVLNTPTVLSTPHGTAHTHYTGWVWPGPGQKVPGWGMKFFPLNFMGCEIF